MAKSAKDWLEVLCAGLERMGSPVTACRAGVGEALVEVVADDGRIEILLSRGGDEPCFATVAGLNVRYRGAGELGASGQRALTVLVRLLEKLESRIPEDLESRLVRGIDGLEAHQALAFAFPFCTAERSEGEGGGAPRISEVLVRLTGRCNQECPFCSAPPRRAEPSPATLERLFLRLDAMAGAATVTLTGGEPTLRPDLPQLVERALAATAAGREVEVQTNAVRFSDAERVAAYPVDAGLRFFVSLHSLDAATYDRCTGTQGMLPRAVEGIQNLLAAGQAVVLSCVANRWNSAGLIDYVDAVAEQLAGPSGLTAGDARLAIHFSITLCPEHGPSGTADALVDYGELAPQLEAAFSRALELGLNPEPLLSSTHASIPACFLSPSFRSRGGAGTVVEERVVADGPGAARGWVKPASCARCSFARGCQGVPEAYARRFGVEGLRPID